MASTLARTATSEAFVDSVLPPGPRSRLLTTYRYATDYVGAMRRWHDRYGPTFTLRDLVGTSVVTSDPELIRQVFAMSAPEAFAAGAPESFDVLLGRRSLLMLPGAAHQPRRKLLNPAFCRDALPSWAQTMVEATRRELAEVEPGQPMVAVERCAAITLRVIVELVFGALGEVGDSIRAAVVETFSRVRPSFLVSRAMQRAWGGLSPYGRYLRASRELDRRLVAHVAARRCESGESLLDAMLASRDERGDALDDATIVDELRSLMIGGHETTSRTLAWALDYLHRDRALLERLRAELDPITAPIEFTRAPLLAAVIDETTRIRPVAGQVFRRLATPATLGGWRLPAGVIVSPAPCLVHLRADLWPAPDRFDPDRFLAGARPRPGVFIPFGGGTHRCIGANLARFETAVVLGTLLREHEFELLESAPPAWVREGLPLGPAGGVPLRHVGRRAPA